MKASIKAFVLAIAVLVVVPSTVPPIVAAAPAADITWAPDTALTSYAALA